MVSEVAGDGGRAALAALAQAGYRLWDLESGRPVAEGNTPFMVAALPGEALGSDRGRRVLAALGEIAGEPAR